MESNNLKKDHLNILETMAMSVAIMAPTAAMALNVALMAGISGFSISLVFILGIVVIGLVSVSFITFNRHFSTAGSVYTFTTKSLGKNAGFISGWLLLLTYIVFTAGSVAEVGSFIQSFFEILHVNVNWLVIAIICTLLIAAISYMDVRISTNVMFILEGISILLIFVLSLVILFKVGSTTGLSATPFKINGNSFSTIGLAVVFAFMSFAGFEGASSLGEETKNPKKLIPIAIISAVFITGLFYLVVSYAQIIGFGINAGGLKALSGSSSPLGDLSQKYISSGYALVIMLGAGLSAFSCALGSASAAGRMLFSMSKEGRLHPSLSKTHKKYQSPYVALGVVIAITFLIILPMFKLPGSAVFGDLGTIGVLSLLLAYLATNIGAIVYFTRKKIWTAKNLIAPVLAIVALAYTFYSNVYPIPAFPSNLFPYIVLGWIVIGIVYLAVKKEAVPSINEKSGQDAE